jgi:leader peptidase (prepilin peptidase)/N-methyltransferase
MAGLGVLGLAAGSVVNVLVERVPDKQPLLPLRLSWPTTRRALGVHLLTAALFAAAAARFGASWVLPAYLFFFASLVAVSAIDLEHHIIPNRIVYPTIFVSVPLLAAAGALTGDWHRFGQALLGATLAWLALFAIHLVSPAGMGFGDVRLAFVLGLFLGWLGLSKVLTGLFLGFFLGAVIGMVLIAFRVRTRKDHIPFGPFLAAGAVVAVLSGTAVTGWLVGGP